MPSVTEKRDILIRRCCLRLLVFKDTRVLFGPTNYFCRDGLDIDHCCVGKSKVQRIRALDSAAPLVVANKVRIQ